MNILKKKEEVIKSDFVLSKTENLELIINKLMVDTIERFVAVCFRKHMGFSTQCTNLFSNLDSAFRLLIRKMKK